jgi:outer membrane receptor for ferrienterochelin and colicin
LLYGGLINQRRFWNNFDNDPKAHFSGGTINDNRDFQLLGFKQDWSFDAFSNVFIKFGFDMKRSSVDYKYSKDIQNEILSPNDTIINRTSRFDTEKTLTGNQLAFYLSTRFRILEPLTLETGLRYDYASYTQDKLWSPRVNLLYSLTRNTSLRSGWGYYYQTQAPDELRIQFEETSTFRAQRAEHYVLGADHRFDNGLYFRTEGYLKKISRMPVKYVTLGADIDEFYPESRDDLVQLTVDKGKAKGIEFYLKYDSGEKISWWLSYVLSETKDHVTDVNYAGKLIERTGSQPRPWDQRHTLNFDAYYRLNTGWQFNLAWQYRSGWSFTDFDVVRLQRPDGTFAYFEDYGTFNTGRYPSYQRLDARINKHFYTSKGKITLFLHVINVLNHTNVSGLDYEAFSPTPGDFSVVKEKETWLGITPFAGVVWEF